MRRRPASATGTQRSRTFRRRSRTTPTAPNTRSRWSAPCRPRRRSTSAAARQLEEKDQLDAALIEYRKAHRDGLAPTGSRPPRAAELERIIRDRIEATRPKPRIDTLREQARQGPPPLLGLRERLRNLNFNNSSVRDILSIIGSSAGIRVTYDQAYQDKAYSIELEDVTVEEALQQIMSANQLFYKVVNPKTIIVVNDRADKRQQYDDMVVRVFYVSHADAQELSQMVTTIMRVPQMPVAPVIMPNKTANTITVRATAQVADIIERIIRSNDKPRAEVVIDVQILEVNRQRVKQYGLNLNAYALGFIFSPEVAPPNTSAPPTGAPPSPPPFNLNTISQGVSTADFYMTVPTALVRFLETDSRTKTIAKPQLRGAEGTEADAQPRRRRPGVADGLRRRGAGRLRDDSAVVVHLPLGRRERRGHAARDLRRRDHPRARRREQHGRADRSTWAASRRRRSAPAR